jgi:hypothetical protein
MCALHNFSLTPPPKQRDFHKAVIFGAGNVDAPTSGYGRLEFALADDALPNLRRANDVSRPASGLRRNGRHYLCVPPLRRRAGPDIDARQNQSRCRSGVTAADGQNPTLRFSKKFSYHPRIKSEAKLFRDYCVNPICASTARPSRPYGLPSVSNISKWL